MKPWEQLDGAIQSTDEPHNVVNKFRIIQKAIQNYPKYVEKSQQAVKFSDPLNLVDFTEFLDNGVVEYKNTAIRGLNSAKLIHVNIDTIDRNTVSGQGVKKKTIRR